MERLITVTTVKKFGQMVAQVVATAFEKFVEERRGPVGIIHLIGVVEEGMGIRSLGVFKRLGEPIEIMCHRLTVKMVDDESFTTGCSAFHLLTRA